MVADLDVYCSYTGAAHIEESVVSVNREVAAGIAELS